MGEYAEMMLNGDCCEACGEFIGMGIGFPQYCSPECAGDRGAQHLPAAPVKKTKCPECGKRVKIAGLGDHLRDVHGAKKGGA
jgi:hypothetical protein